MSQPLSPVEELQERYRSAADEYPDLDGLAAALRAVADQVVPEYKVTPGGSKIWPSEPLPSIRAKFLAIAAELEAT